MNSLNIKKGDMVLIIAGADKNKKGKVLAVSPKHSKIVVDGVNIQKKHKKARSAQDVGGIKEQEGAIDISNAQVICPVCNKPTRVGHSVDAKGKTIRVCKQVSDDGKVCGASLETKKEAKKDAKKTTAKVTRKKVVKKEEIAE